MFFDDALDVAEFRQREAVVGGQRDTLQPEFCLEVVACGVNVRRLAIFATLKMETIGPTRMTVDMGAIPRRRCDVNSGARCPTFSPQPNAARG